MTFLVWAAIVASIALIAVVGLGAFRLRALARRVGSFECGTRPHSRPDASWSHGIAQYGVGRIDYWPAWSISLRPAQTWRRADLVVVGRAPLDDAANGLLLVTCTHQGVSFELTMSPAAYAGLASWLEAAPPGRQGAAV